MKFASRLFYFIFFTTIAFVLSAAAQRVAIVVPDDTKFGKDEARLLASELDGHLRILDADVVASVIGKVAINNWFNLDSESARQISDAIGCDYLIIVKSDSLRRSSFAAEKYFESYIVTFLVSSRSGLLIDWRLVNAESDDQANSQSQLNQKIKGSAEAIRDKISLDRQRSADESTVHFPPVPDLDDSAKDRIQPPIPYKRLKPQYTKTASLYSVRATVDVFADIDENGKVVNIVVDRWAGFGLDESAVQTVREMNWRPAMRNGKALPMRVLLRYNFTRLEKL